MKRQLMSIISVKPSGSPLFALDPFLFCAYHRDLYPAGNERMEAPRRGNGMDFDPRAPYRMYHGDKIPGFPQHPHKGFETLTAVLEGTCDHSDSLGSYGRFGDGDLQWMSAGSGVVHGENFPLIHQDKSNHLKLFQLWLNLPAKSKMTPPGYIMNWNEDSVTIDGENGAKLRLFAGDLLGRKGGKCPDHSWAVNPENDVGVYFISLPSLGSSFSLPASNIGSAANRVVHVVEGHSALIDGQSVKSTYGAILDASKPVTFTHPGAVSDAPVELLVLQGRPIKENVVQRGPFVVNSEQELMATYREYQQTQFGGWPWKEDAVTFPRDKGRFAVLVKGGEETGPNAQNQQCRA